VVVTGDDDDLAWLGHQQVRLLGHGSDRRPEVTVTWLVRTTFGNE